MRLFKKQLVVSSLNVLVFLVLASTISNYTTSYFEGEATTGTVTITIPLAGSNGTTALTTATIFSDATVGLNTISPSQTIISSALLVSNTFAGTSGYLFGNTTTFGGSFAFKTSQYVTSISATFTKFSTELSTVFLRSGGSAKAASADGEIGVSQTFLSGDSTITLTWSPVSSYYFSVGTNTATTDTNNAYLTSLSVTYNNTMKLSLYKSYNFSNGGSSSNSSYATEDVATSVAFETNDPLGGADTNWEGDYIHAGLIYGTRLGAASTAKTSAEQTDNITAWANLKTLFSFDKSIDYVRLMSVVVNNENSGSSLFGNFILQYSTDSATTWTTISTKSDTSISKGILVFDGFTIPVSSRLRIGITWGGSLSNIQVSFTGIELYSYEQC